jgi:hypothetical protein
MGTAPSQALPLIPVLLYGSSVVPADAFIEAKREAARIFREAGIEMAWFDCSARLAGGQPEPACQGTLLPSHVLLTIVPRWKRQYQRVRSGSPVLMEMLGEAICSGPTGGNDVTIYFKIVERRAQKSDARRARLLGYVIAHEIGHLLLGPQHSTGIMATDWAEKDVLKVPADELLFSAADRGRLETKVRARLAADEQVAFKARR